MGDEGGFSGWAVRAQEAMREFFRRVSEKDVFFMAGAIAFNLVVAIVPLVLLLVGLGAFLLEARVGDPTTYILGLVLDYLPAIGGDVALVEEVRRTVGAVVAERAGFSIVGAGFFLWLSTRLVGTLRTVLREVFELERDRGIVYGKLFDAGILLVTFGFVVINFGVTFFLRGVRDFGIELLGLEGRELALAHWLFAQGLAFGSAWVLFFLIYRYLPAKRTPWRASVVAATVMAVCFELMKAGFAWYVTQVANFATAYGPLATGAILFFWIYYSSLVFVLSGHVGYIYQVRRMRRMDRFGAGARTKGARKGERKTSAVVVALLGLGLAVGSADLEAQAFMNGRSADGSALNGGGGEVLFQDRILDRELQMDRPLVDYDGPYVIVHIQENRVFVVEDDRIVWSSRAGTGHGFSLAGQGQEWTFTTPVGLFRIQRMEKDPVWQAPDWWYVQRDIPIPTHNRDRARIPGTLGTTAIFLGDGLAIHGTDQPQLLLNDDPEARRISHGCIRLTDEAVRELYHRVSVGTPVLIF